MKPIAAAVLAVVMAVSAWSQQALAQDGNGPAPVEAFFCNLQEGKSMKDLMAVADRFAKWADKNDPSYSAWILTSQFAQFRDMPRVIWLGSNPDGNALGRGMDTWQATGGDIQKAFDDVIQCAAHGLASSVEILAPDGPPGDGVVMFVQCSIAEGSDWMKAVGAHKRYAQAMRDLGAKNSAWLFFPMLGGAEDRDFDYWGVSTFANWTDYFAAYELYVSGGGYQKALEATKGVASCEQGTPTVWDVKLVHKGAS